jgi:hypothetical protein
MSAEQMRTELEIFVNDGLREGWEGWPLKSESQKGQSGLRRLSMVWLRIWRSGRRRPVARRGRLGLLALSA